MSSGSLRYNIAMREDHNMFDKQSCLKKKLAESPRGNHRATSSQVRFSLPPEEDQVSCEETDAECVFEGKESERVKMKHQSPNRIVFPKVSKDSEDVLGFVDYTNKMTVRVPKQILDFHNRNSYDVGQKMELGGVSHCVSLNGSPMKSNGRRNSMQSIILETIENYRHNDFSKREDDFKGTPALVPGEGRNCNLYLGSDSPMNKYEVPIPLEIKAPPYLSPVNKHKRRKSLIFDGDGYSVYLDDKDLPLDSESIHSKYSDNTLSFSDISIPSAENNFSFSISDGDIDSKLGIDDDANVHLKKQVKNLKKMSSNQNLDLKMGKLSPTASKKLPTTNNSTKSLEILTTPVKEILIPDIEDISISNNKRNSLQFFETDMHYQLECNKQDNLIMTNNDDDELNINFKFPKQPQLLSENTNSAQIPIIHSNYTNEKKEVNHSTVQHNRKTHRHQRSKSIHQIEIENLPEIKTPERDNNSKRDVSTFGISTPEIPVRSPLRPKSSQISLKEKTDFDDNSFIIPSTEDLISIYSVGSKIVENSLNNSDGYINDSKFSFENSPIIEIEKDVNSTTNSIEKIINNRLKTSRHGNEDTSESKLPSNSKQKREISLEPKPLSTFQSFRNGIVTPTVPTFLPGFHAYSLNTKSHINSLHPARKLSNNFSHSSNESDISFDSHPSVATTATQVSCGNSNFVSGKKPSKPPIKSYLDGVNNKHFDRSVLKTDSAEKDELNEISFKTVLEEVDGKFVEMILIDEPDENDHSMPLNKRHSVEKTKRRSQELDALCEQTAKEIKDVIEKLTFTESPTTIKDLKEDIPHMIRNKISQHHPLHTNYMSSDNRRRYMERVLLKKGQKRSI